jgi:hypothetical protein
MPRHLLRLYAACARLIWNSYAVSSTFGGDSKIPLIFGSAMKDHSRTELANPYSPLMCGLLLLTVFAVIQLKLLAVF